MIWIPRVLLLPVHLVLEYLVRWPLVSLVTVVEKHHVIEKVQDIFSFSDRAGGSGTVYPTFFWDFGTQITVGALASYERVWGSNHSLSARVDLWPGQNSAIGVGDEIKVFRDESGTVTARFDYLDRRDFPFFGVGPETTEDDETVYRKRQFQGELSLRTALSGLNRIGFGTFYRTAKPRSTTVDRSVEEVFDVDDPAEVPGWEETYHLLAFESKLELDTRSPDRIFMPGSGLRLEAFGSFAVSPHRPALNFFRWGGEAAGFLDLSGNNNVLAIRLYAAALESTGADPIPITELLQLGGHEHLRGFSVGRFHGQSALVATASYRYPIWMLLDADIFVGLGNVFDGRWERLHIKRMVMNWGLALRTSMSRVTSLDLLLAFGTNRFEQWSDDFQLENIRVTIAVNQGF